MELFINSVIILNVTLFQSLNLASNCTYENNTVMKKQECLYKNQVF